MELGTWASHSLPTSKAMIRWTENLGETSPLGKTIFKVSIKKIQS